MELNKLKYTKGSRNHKSKTYGRGFGSGIGKTSGKGTKGQKSRKSGKVRLGFEGGQTPLYRKIPKVGFNNYNFKNEYSVINLDQIIKLNTKDITNALLIEKRLIKSKSLPIKLIGSRLSAKITSPIFISVDKASKNVIALIEKSGGKVTITKK